MLRTRLLPLLLLATFALAPVAPVAADHEVNTRKDLEEIGFHDLGGDGFNTDVWTWIGQDGGLYATSGTWGAPSVVGGDPGEECPSETDNPMNPDHSGVKIVDATDPANPVMASRLGTVPGAQNNDPKVARLPTDDGPMDLLVNSLEPCGVEGIFHQIPGSPPADFVSEVLGTFDQDVTGFQIWNVNDPRNPERLGKYENGGVGTHNLYLYSKGGKSYVAAVFNSIDQFEIENDFITGYLDIVDITDPSNPTRISRWGLGDNGPPYDDLCKPRGVDSQFCYNHDVWVSDDGNTAYLSFWDAGLILLDISDPANPMFIGQGQGQLQQDPGTIIRSGEAPEALAADPEGWLNEEGNTHVAVPMSVDGRELVLVGDEDFTGGGQIGVTVNSPGPVTGFNLATQWAGTAPADGQTADMIYVGTGCTAADYALAGGPPAVGGKIVFVDANAPAAPFPPCPTYTFAQKVNLAAANGAIGFVQIPNTEPNTNATAGAATIPALEVFRNPDTEAVRAAVIANAPPVNATLGRGGDIDPWGFMRVVDVTDPSPANWRELTQFRAPHVDDQVEPDPRDVFTAHNPLIGPDGKVYFAWYTDGVRVLEPDADQGSNPGQFNESAWFVPRPDDHPDDNEGDPHGAQEDHVGFWGSQAIAHPAQGQLLVFNSDLNRGLYILSAEPFPLPDKCPGLEHLKGNHIVGTGLRETLVGTNRRDIICARGASDVVRGRGGNDVIDAGSGNDEVDGGSGNDRILGSDGDDLVRGGPGNDRILGGLDDDRLIGRAGNDRLIGQEGNDALRGQADADRLSGGPGNDRVSGARGPDRLRGGDGDDVVRGHAHPDRAAGGPGDDRVVGGGADDRLKGQRGDDFLHGAGGDDRIRGGPGKDRIKGGGGRDRCNGGGGKDRVSGCGQRR